MKVLVVGKFPPIQGGVSAQTFWLAHELANRGHQVSMITNAREVERAYRIYMRPKDWARCEASVHGNLKVYWTAPFDRSQRHIPFQNPFVTKLVSLGLQAAVENGADVVLSFYLEPYAVAGHIIARELGIPHVVKTAGSDLGRLRVHPQYKPFYDRILSAASSIWTAGLARNELVNELGLDANSVYSGAVLATPNNLFEPAGDELNLESLVEDIKRDNDGRSNGIFGTPRSDLCYFGIYGKIAENKGVYDLLAAVAQIADRSNAGLLVMGGAREQEVARFHSEVRRLGLEDRVLHIPFLPNWRVPEFIRRCFAVCCLERDFPIVLHAPVIAREVMLCGACLLGSTEILRKMPQAERLIDGYNCIAIDEVKDVDALAVGLAKMLAAPERVRLATKRAADYAAAIRQTSDGVTAFEQALLRTFDKTETLGDPVADETPPPWLRMVRLIHEKVEPRSLTNSSCKSPLSLDQAKSWARGYLSKAETNAEANDPLCRDILRICMIVADVGGIRRTPTIDEFSSSVCRLQHGSWAVADDEISKNVTTRPIGRLVIEKFSIDANEVLSAIHLGQLPASLTTKESHLVVQFEAGSMRPRVFVLDEASAHILFQDPETVKAARSNEHVQSAFDEARLELFKVGLIGLASR